jgi:hypothetical protein
MNEEIIHFCYTPAILPTLFLLGIFCASKDKLLRRFFTAPGDDGFIQTKY